MCTSERGGAHLTLDRAGHELVIGDFEAAQGQGQHIVEQLLLHGQKRWDGTWLEA